MKARDIMTPHPATVAPSDPAQRAAQLMTEVDCGFLPVVSDDDSHALVGIVTDRDLALRTVAAGRSPDTTVNDVMTTDPLTVTLDAKLDEVEKLMADHQIRRVVVVDDSGECVGVISQADLALSTKKGRKPTPESFATVLNKISQPHEHPPA
jgi:CBS domain-containing protein